MLNPFICGSFHNQQEDEYDSPCSTPRRSRKSSKDSKNPYSTLGLDKFSALLADLEKKRQKIYSQVDPQDISIVRFAFSSSNDCVPIVVKLKDPNRHSSDKDERKDDPKTTHVLDKSRTTENQETKQPRLEIEKNKTTEKKRMLTWNFKLNKWRRPYYYMPVFIILILLFLAFFGRSVAILCTSVGWYLVPTLSSSSRRTATKNNNKNNNKKQLLRRFSEISPRSQMNNSVVGDVKDKSNHGRQNSF
ncbi:hypothetical protein JCGZ_16021 [Jatropha curcas]|uniref:ZCF37 n=1 Tax=Jatropha curcas TaxID=180498 RepID=A0A067LBY4_JATCU|nr:uncharacterized protein LOC105630842 [Jatropha curcas]KDP41614.1 hypothetical protein JCGZ_16021 [Jatropha curcas]